MGHIVGGRLYGTGEDCWVCIGFVPDWIKLISIAGAVPGMFLWDRTMQGELACCDGVLIVPDDGGAPEDLLTGVGLKTYHGGETLVSGTGTLGVGTTTFANTANVYLTWDDGGDYRFLPANKANGLGDATAQDIDTWTMDSGGATGYFNDDIVGTYIGKGSLIIIDGKRYSITTCAAAAGAATTEVVLSHTSVKSGEVQYIGGMVNMKSYLAGEVTKAGFWMDSTHEFNVTTEIIGFQAGTWDI